MINSETKKKFAMGTAVIIAAIAVLGAKGGPKQATKPLPAADARPLMLEGAKLDRDYCTHTRGPSEGPTRDKWVDCMTDIYGPEFRAAAAMTPTERWESDHLWYENQKLQAAIANHRL